MLFDFVLEHLPIRCCPVDCVRIIVANRVIRTLDYEQHMELVGRSPFVAGAKDVILVDHQIGDTGTLPIDGHLARVHWALGRYEDVSA